MNSVFVWENVPDSVNINFLNQTLFLDGIVCWFKENEELKAINCGFGGGLNEYYVPEEAIVANPRLGSYQLKNNEECVVMANSSTDWYCQQGLTPLLEQYATLLADNIVSINVAQINSRATTLFTADSVALKNSAEQTLRQIYAGKPYQVLEQNLIDSISINPISSNNINISDLIELNNYILSNFYKAIGIMENDVRKKERLITDEINSQANVCEFNIFDMLEERVEGIKRINEMFGTDIKVYINPILREELQVKSGEEVEEVEDALEPVENEELNSNEEPVEEEEVKEKEEDSNENV